MKRQNSFSCIISSTQILKDLGLPREWPWGYHILLKDHNWIRQACGSQQNKTEIEVNKIVLVSWRKMLCAYYCSNFMGAQPFSFILFFLLESQWRQSDMHAWSSGLPKIILWKLERVLFLVRIFFLLHKHIFKPNDLLELNFNIIKLKNIIMY